MKRGILVVLMLLCLLPGGHSAGVATVAQGDGTKVVVALPFSKRGLGSGMVEFYRGFLLAVDSVARCGGRVEVFAFDSEKEIEGALAAVESADLVVCPQDSLLIAQLSRAAAEDAMVVSPFYRWSLEMETNPTFFALNPTLRVEDEQTIELMRGAEGSSRVVLVETGGRTSSLATRLKIETDGLRVVALDEALKGMRSILGETEQRDAIVLSSNDRESMNSVLSLLSGLRREGSDLDFCLIGYSTWPGFVASGSVEIVEDWFLVDTYISSLYHFDAASAAAKRLEGAWIENFDEPLPMGYPALGVYGWDVGMQFLLGKGEGLQHRFRFARYCEGGGWINEGVCLVHYDTAHGVSIVTLNR